jgi:hypothetical protein
MELLETLAQELERPREVSPQVARHLLANYDVMDDQVGPFLVETLSTLEEDEIDLILSPLFTPKLDDQSVFAGKLGQVSVSSDEQARLVAEAIARPVNARLVSMDNLTHRVRLAEVTVERYVYRLRLEGTIPESILELIGRFPSDDHALLHAVARRAIWESDERSGILGGYLAAAERGGALSADEFRSLLDLVERYKPTGIADLVAKTPRWQEGLRSDLNTAAGGKPFFSDQIHQSHGGDRDRRSPEGSLMESKRHDLAFLERLGSLLVP